MKFLVVVVTALAVLLSGVLPPLRTASAQSNPDVSDMSMTVRINQNGFFDEKNRRLGPQNPIRVPEGKVVKITFVFDESVTSLAYGDVHQMAIASEDGWTIESEKLWMFNQKGSLTFQAGEKGRKRYRAYCILDCIGMEHLNNLVILVG